VTRGGGDRECPLKERGGISKTSVDVPTGKSCGLASSSGLFQNGKYRDSEKKKKKALRRKERGRDKLDAR